MWQGVMFYNGILNQTENVQCVDNGSFKYFPNLYKHTTYTGIQ